MSECQVCGEDAVWDVAVAASEPWPHVVQGVACEAHVAEVERVARSFGDTVRLRPLGALQRWGLA